jgi:hypothetical protein
MRARRLVCFFIGVWLGGCVLMAWLTTDSFRSVDRMLMQHTPQATLQIRPLGPDARALFRYQVSEQNRAAFETWEWVQLAFGGCLFLFILLGSREGKFLMALVLVMLAIVAIQRWLFTPALVMLGRELDFAVADTLSGKRQEFWIVHTAYSAAEVAKWVVGLILAGMMTFGRGRGRSGDTRDELDAIDKRNYRHVDR